MTTSLDDRYAVFKRKDLRVLDSRTLVKVVTHLEELDYYTRFGRQIRGKNPRFQCLVIESTWPEYEVVKKMLEERIEKEKQDGKLG